MRWRFEAADAGKAYSVRFDLLAHLQAHAAAGSDLEAAALIFGELVGNVVRHAPGPISLELFWDGDTAVLRVIDKGPGFDWNGAAALPELFAESGRGLFIAHNAARRLRVRRVAGNGTEATAWLPVSLERCQQA